MASSISPPPPAVATTKPAPAPLHKRPKNRPPAVARFIIDELRGDAGFVSEDIWRDVFGFQKKVAVTDRKLEDIDLNGMPHSPRPRPPPTPTPELMAHLAQRNPRTSLLHPPFTSPSRLSPPPQVFGNGPSSQSL
jgi:hypothetical protein